MAPANTLILLDQACLELRPFDGSGIQWFSDSAGFEVTVDGEPAALVKNTDDAIAAGLGFLVEPPLVPGASVVITGADDSSVAFTVEAADDIAPAAAQLESLSDEEGSGLFECETTALRLWEIGVTDEALGPLIYAATMESGIAGPAVHSRFDAAADGVAQFALRESLDGVDPDACVDVRAFDIAGNEADVATLCRGEAEADPAAENGSDANPADPTARGCSLSPTPRTAPGVLIAMLVGFAAIRRRS